MEINKYNYEIVLIDYLDGKLNPLEVAELLLFLEQHPDIKAEFEGLENVSISSIEQETFPAKDALKKKSAPITIDDNTINKFLVRKVEGDLNTHESVALSSFLATHKKYHRDLLLFEKTKLIADASILFPDKKSLKRGAKIIPLFHYVSAVAAILIFIFAIPILFQYFQSSNKINSSVADNSSIIKTEQQIIIPKEKEIFVKNNKPELAFSTKKNAIITKENKHIVSKNKIKIVEEPAIVNPIAENKNNTIQKTKDSISTDNTATLENTIEATHPKQNVETINNSVAQNQNTQQKNVSTIAAEKSFLSLKDLAQEKIKSISKDNLKEENSSTVKANKKITGWDIAALGVKAINKLSGKKIKLSNKYNEDGHLVEYAIASNNFEFSRQK